MGVRIVWRADVLHFVTAAALGAARDGPVAGHLFRVARCRLAAPEEIPKKKGRLEAIDGWPTYREPNNDVRVGRAACAAGVLLIAGGFDFDGVLECTYIFKGQ